MTIGARTVFERFTERARQVVVIAQEEARTRKHEQIGTEHMLLGLLREEHGLAARALENLGVTLEKVATEVPQGDGNPSRQQIPFTKNAQHAMELGLREALSLGHNYIGTEHLLLGLVRENDLGAMILLRLDVDAEAVRAEVMRQLNGERTRQWPPKPQPAPQTMTRDQHVALLTALHSAIGAALDALREQEP